MAHNRYYIVNVEDPNIIDILKLAVGVPSTQKTSIDGTLVIIKLPDEDHEHYPILDDYTELDHDQIRAVLLTPEWYPDDYPT